ncbi:MAG: 1-acyl-sn-glycerol-3-phosphate acyltransferase [Spirochaetes bacterium]|nr:1-acyl-sn-glycerol-3-phosphate acyltransferase [Spirochaetota bacterium]MBU1080988.1 1-acyl-sn-glycerol-3-phosphate acyltransferase [Spirochaetota bacterium]
MIDKARYRPRAPRWFNIVLRYTLGGYLKRRYRIRAVGADVFKTLRPPYVLIPTHHGTLDPFMISYFVPVPVYWVTSDGNMRSSVMKFLLGLVGSIPKSKSIPDMETIGWIVDVIRKRGGVVGIFAEGQASWDGHTQEIIPSTGKLVKLLKVPVVVAVLKGAYYSQPRWAWNKRPGDMEIEFKLVMDGAGAKARSAEDITAALEAAMAHDEEEWRENHPVRYRASGRAKHLELALFMCPHCGQVGTMRSYINRLYCRACGNVARLSRSYKFTAVGSSRPKFDSIREWDLWQREAFSALLENAAASPEAPVFADTGVLLLRGHRTNPLRPLRTGTMILYPDRIELATLLGERLSFPIPEIEGESVLKQQLFEFYQGKTLFQFRFPRRFQSARKWLSAIEALKALQAAAASGPR